MKITEKQMNKIVKDVLRRRCWCEHDNYMDCNRCLGKWIRNAIKKVLK